MSKKVNINISKEELYEKYIVKNISSKAISEELKCSQYYLLKKLREFNIPIKTGGVPKGTIIRDLKGEIFGRLMVLEHFKTENKKSYWKCLCLKCNIEKIIRSDSLVCGKATGCGCVKIEFYSNTLWKGYGKLSGSYWCSVKESACNRNLDFNITIEYAWNIFLKQKEKCALSGMEIYFTRNRQKELPTASLDRIDSSKGYIEGNIQWVHKIVQRMKMDLDEKIFIETCKMIEEYSSNKYKENKNEL